MRLVKGHKVPPSPFVADLQAFVALRRTELHEGADPHAPRPAPPDDGLPPDPREPTFRCALCQDEPSGWAMPVWCPTTPCGRRMSHQPHAWTARCRCWLLKNRDAIILEYQDSLAKDRPVPANYEALRRHGLLPGGQS